MDWSLLLLLACPLMMLFCMKGMFTGNKDKKSATNAIQQGKQAEMPNEIQSIQLKMTELMEQNHELMNEIKEIKKTQGNNELQQEGPKLKAVNE
jgi:predicted transcriptional regulator